MKDYLYILPFKDGKHFKIGISANHFNRVQQHHRTYDIDYDKSLIFLSKRSTVNSLESLLLSMTNKIDDFFGLDGHTEVRKMEELNLCLEFLDNFKHKDVVKKKKLMDVIDKPFFIREKVKPVIPKKKEPIVKHNNSYNIKSEMDYILTTMKKETALNKAALIIVLNIKSKLKDKNTDLEKLLRQTMEDIADFLVANPKDKKCDRFEELVEEASKFFC